jgi:hypothetical protein
MSTSICDEDDALPRSARVESPRSRSVSRVRVVRPTRQPEDASSRRRSASTRAGAPRRRHDETSASSRDGNAQIVPEGGGSITAATSGTAAGQHGTVDWLSGGRGRGRTGRERGCEGESLHSDQCSRAGEM